MATREGDQAGDRRHPSIPPLARTGNLTLRAEPPSTSGRSGCGRSAQAERPAGRSLKQRSGSCLCSPHARSRHRRHRPQPDRPGFQGLVEGDAPGRPGCPDHHGPPRQSARGQPGPDRGPAHGVRTAGGRGRLQHRPGGGGSRRPRRVPRRHGQPVLLLLAPDDPDGCPCDPGRRRRLLHRRRCRDDEPLPRRERRWCSEHAQRQVRRRRGANGATGRGGCRSVGASRGTTRPIHSDGPDGRECRRVRERHPPADGRVRMPLAEPGGREPGERLLRA